MVTNACATGLFSNDDIAFSGPLFNAVDDAIAGRLTSREGPRRPLILGELIVIAGLLGMLVFDADTPINAHGMTFGAGYRF